MVLSRRTKTKQANQFYLFEKALLQILVPLIMLYEKCRATGNTKNGTRWLHCSMGVNTESRFATRDEANSSKKSQNFVSIIFCTPFHVFSLGVIILGKPVLIRRYSKQAVIFGRLYFIIQVVIQRGK